MSKIEKNHIIAVIGGGSGCLSIEDFLLDQTPEVIGITGAYDNGGHSGEIRSVLGVLPPGDATHRMAIRIRDLAIRGLFTHRWKLNNHGINGHRPANELLAAAEHRCGSHSGGIKLVERSINSYLGKIVPVTDDDIHLRAILEDGSCIDGEDKIDQREEKVPAIIDLAFINKDRTSLSAPQPNLESIESIYNADALVIAPGSWWTSIMPVLKTPGIADAIKYSKVPIIWCCNAVTNHAETHDYKASSFAEKLSTLLEKEIDYGLINIIQHGIPPTYFKDESYPVEPDVENCRPFVKRIYTGPLTEVCSIGGVLVIRHNGERVGKVVMDILEEKRAA